MKIFVESERFILREMLMQDIEGLFELDSDPEVHKYLGNKPLSNKAQCAEVVEWVRYQYAQHGIGRWSVIDKQTGDFMGWAGLKWNVEENDPHGKHYDLGYRLVRRFWGQGIGYECAKESLKYGFEGLGIDKIYAAAHIKNAASNKILQKIGMQFVETFLYEEAVHNWYEIHKQV